jgi:acyl transferase domain-containing protein
VRLVLAGGVSITVPQKSGIFIKRFLSRRTLPRPLMHKAQGTVSVMVWDCRFKAVGGWHLQMAIEFMQSSGSAINNDGALKVGYTAPSVDGQAKVIAEAQAIAGIHLKQSAM